MKRASKLFLTFLLLSLFLNYFPGNTQADSGDYIIFRAKASPFYIENETIQIQFYAVVFRDNKPTNENCDVHIEIQGLNINESYNTTMNIRGGKIATKYLPGMLEGHYKITLFAEKDGITSEEIKQDFGVTKPPVPYTCFFDGDGSHIYFKSEKLNETGEIDPDFPFTLYIYVYQHGTGETLVQTVTNVTKIKITVSEEWKNGIVYVDVVDCWGWRNSATMDFQNMQFEGTPLSYDYLYELREPYKSRQWLWVGSVMIIMIAVLIIVSKLNEKRRQYYE